VLGLLSTISISGAAWTIHSAYASAEKRVESVGQQVVRGLGPLLGDEPASLRVNGSQMYLSATTTSQSPQAAIDRLEHYCHENAPSLAATIRSMNDIAGQSQRMRDPASWLTARSSKDYTDVAHLACIARPNAGSLQDFTTRLAAFAFDGDLSHIGSMIYVIATRETDGNSRVMAVWSSGGFQLSKMFPTAGDAPGSDSAAVPRPPESVRLLSAALDGQSFGVRLYDTPQSPADVLTYYDQRTRELSLPALPLFPEDSRDSTLTASPSYARAYSTSRGLLLVTAIEDPMGGSNAQVSVLELGRPSDTEQPR
jgi:hypothetical protein